MARGFLSGILWGTALGGGVSAAASLMAPLPTAPEVADAAPGSVEAPERVALADSGNGRAATSDRAVVAAQTAPQAPTPDPDGLSALNPEATETATQPELGTAAGLEGPVETAAASGIAVTPDAPVLPNPQALAPMAPQDADDLSISTEPAQPPAPEALPEETAFAAPERAEEVDAVAQPEGSQPETLTQEAALPEATSEDASQETAVPETEITETASAQTTEDAPVPSAGVPAEASARPASDTEEPEPEVTEAEETEREAPETETAEAATQTPEPQTPTEDAARTAPEETADAAEEDAEAPIETASARPQIGTPGVALIDRDTGVTIRRPGAATLGEIDEGQAAEEVADVGVETAADPRPVARFAAPFEDPAGKPLMSIVLIDDGSSPVAGAAGIAALQGFPYPLTFAVDAARADAGDRMAIYRAAGFEVMAMIDLPEGAQPGDAETALGAILPQLPEVVGVLEGDAGGLQGARDVSDQVTSILKDSGHGLLTQNRGLNTMASLARREGVPAAPIFRDFDSKGQTAQVIRRFLDQAAFRAGQEGAVVMLGRLRPDTVSALLLWGLQDRAGRVALVPVSAVLLREDA